MYFKNLCYLLKLFLCILYYYFIRWDSWVYKKMIYLKGLKDKLCDVKFVWNVY